MREKMRRRRFWAFGIVVTLAVLLTGLGQARADTFDFTYTDYNNGQDIKITGSMTANQNPAGSNLWDATSGSATIVSGAGVYNGTTYTLVPNPSYPTPIVDTTDSFQFDDKLSPGNLPNNELDIYGLVFANTTGSQALTLNIFGYSSATDYSLLQSTGTQQWTILDGTTNPSGGPAFGTFTAQDVPETSSLLLLGLGLVGVSAAFSKRYRKV